MEVAIGLKLSDPFGVAVKDALLKSSALKMVVNPWVKPGTMYQGEGMTLTLEESGTSIGVSLRGKMSDLNGLSTSDNFVGFQGRGGIALGLMKILRASTSPYVIKKSHGQLAILPDKASFGNGSLDCSPSFDDPSYLFCSFHEL